MYVFVPDAVFVVRVATVVRTGVSGVVAGVMDELKLVGRKRKVVREVVSVGYAAESDEK